MDKIFILFLIAQLLTTAFGISVIESVRPLVEKKLHDKGYVQKRQNSLYEFNDKATNVLKGFIPFYYFIKALNIINNKNIVNDKVKEEIDKGNYILLDNIKKEEEPVINDVYNPELSIAKKPELIFEEPVKYKAKKNDIKLYDTYETPIEYITREAPLEDSIEVTPFDTEKKDVIEVKEEEKEEKVKVSKADIAKAISELDLKELELLKSNITRLEDIKREDLSLKKIKDAA